MIDYLSIQSIKKVINQSKPLLEIKKNINFGLVFSEMIISQKSFDPIILEFIEKIYQGNSEWRDILTERNGANFDQFYDMLDELDSNLCKFEKELKIEGNFFYNLKIVKIINIILKDLK